MDSINQKGKNILEIKIEEIGLDEASYYNLKKAGFSNLLEIISMSEEDFLLASNFSEKQFSQLKEIIKEYDLHFEIKRSEIIAFGKDIDELNLGSTLSYILKQSGITTILQLMNLSKTELDQLLMNNKLFGVNNRNILINEVENALTAYKASLKKEANEKEINSVEEEPKSKIDDDLKRNILLAKLLIVIDEGKTTQKLINLLQNQLNQVYGEIDKIFILMTEDIKDDESPKL